MVLFVWFCMRFVWPLIMNMIEERQTQIADGLAAAEEGSRSLEKAEVKIAGMIEEARTQGRDIIDEANTRGSGIVDEARVEEVIRKIVEIARTGRMGDGKIFVLPAEAHEVVIEI